MQSLDSGFAAETFRFKCGAQKPQLCKLLRDLLPISRGAAVAAGTGVHLLLPATSILSAVLGTARPWRTADHFPSGLTAANGRAAARCGVR